MESIERHRAEPGKRTWTFISNHCQVLLAIAGEPERRVSEIADAFGITERYVYRLLSDLQQAGYVSRSRQGRCNRYRLNADLAIGDPVVEEQSLRQLLALVGLRDQRDLLVA